MFQLGAGGPKSNPWIARSILAQLLQVLFERCSAPLLAIAKRVTVVCMKRQRMVCTWDLALHSTNANQMHSHADAACKYRQALGRDGSAHVSPLRLSVHEDIEANALLLVIGVLHVVVDHLLVVLRAELALLELQAGTAQLCIPCTGGLRTRPTSNAFADAEVHNNTNNCSAITSIHLILQRWQLYCSFSM